MKKEKYIVLGDSYNVIRLIKSFKNISNHIECIVGDYEEEKINNIPTFYYIEDAIERFGKDIVVAVSSEYDMKNIKEFLNDNFGIADNSVIELRLALLNILKNDYNVKLTPISIRLELCTLCQLNCLDCYMRKNNYGNTGKGYLNFENFKKIVDQNEYIEEIEISNSGEVFLNPDIVKILQYAYKKNICITIENGVNFNTISEKVIEALVKYQVNSMTFSIDGASQETYSIYRRNGNFDKVIDNIKLLIKYKEKYNSQIPYLKWQYILMNHNECDIKKAKKIAKSLDIEIYFKKDWENKYKPKDKKKILNLTGLDYDEKPIDSPFCWQDCIQMILFPQINYDGRILGCCTNFQHDWNLNSLDSGLTNCLNSEYYMNGIYRLLGDGQIKNNGDPCCKCWYYDLIDKEKKFIEL